MADKGGNRPLGLCKDPAGILLHDKELCDAIAAKLVENGGGV